jgi:hypothetical protein
VDRDVVELRDALPDANTLRTSETCRIETVMRDAHTPGCRHLLCERIGGPCSLATNRSRGCRPGLASKEIAPEIFDEVRALVARLDRDPPAAVRLAQLIRREALDNRNLVALARDEDPELAAVLAALCVRRPG